MVEIREESTERHDGSGASSSGAGHSGDSGNRNLPAAKSFSVKISSFFFKRWKEFSVFFDKQKLKIICPKSIFKKIMLKTLSELQQFVSENMSSSILCFTRLLTLYFAFSFVFPIFSVVSYESAYYKTLAAGN